jgi:hypothetical protein
MNLLPREIIQEIFDFLKEPENNKNESLLNCVNFNRIAKGIPYISGLINKKFVSTPHIDLKSFDKVSYFDLKPAHFYDPKSHVNRFDARFKRKISLSIKHCGKLSCLDNIQIIRSEDVLLLENKISIGLSNKITLSYELLTEFGCKNILLFNLHRDNIIDKYSTMDWAYMYYTGTRDTGKPFNGNYKFDVKFIEGGDRNDVYRNIGSRLYMGDEDKYAETIYHSNADGTANNKNKYFVTHSVPDNIDKHYNLITFYDEIFDTLVVINSAFILFYRDKINYVIVNSNIFNHSKMKQICQIKSLSELIFSKYDDSPSQKYNNSRAIDEIIGYLSYKIEIERFMHSSGLIITIIDRISGNNVFRKPYFDKFHELSFYDISSVFRAEKDSSSGYRYIYFYPPSSQVHTFKNIIVKDTYRPLESIFRETQEIVEIGNSRALVRIDSIVDYVIPIEYVILSSLNNNPSYASNELAGRYEKALIIDKISKYNQKKQKNKVIRNQIKTQIKQSIYQMKKVNNCKKNFR